MSDEQRLIVDIVSRRDYKNLEKQGKTESNDVYTKKAKGKSAWEALENLKEVAIIKNKKEQLTKETAKALYNGSIIGSVFKIMFLKLFLFIFC